MLTPLITFALRYSGECAFMGITPQAQLYIEEYYGDDLAFLAQSCFDADGTLVAYTDEDHDHQRFMPLALPDNSSKPQPHFPKHAFNYRGARRRGLREPEHLLDWVQPLSIVEKMTLIDALKIAVPPPQIAGIAESRVLAQAILPNGVTVICRTLYVALLLPIVAYDAAGLPYDYDTLRLDVAQLIQNPLDDDTAWLNYLPNFYGVRLHRPQDCLVYGDRLWIADGGDSLAGRRSQIHSWQIVG